jgi:hypothetical protein
MKMPIVSSRKAYPFIAQWSGAVWILILTIWAAVHKKPISSLAIAVYERYKMLSPPKLRAEKLNLTV